MAEQAPHGEQQAGRGPGGAAGGGPGELAGRGVDFGDLNDGGVSTNQTGVTSGAAEGRSREADSRLTADSSDSNPVVDLAAEPSARLLAAAGPIFARDGFERATIREICRTAETNVASVAYYFGDKMGLYLAVIRRIREAREREFPSPQVTEAEPCDQLFHLVRTILSRMLAGDASGWESQLMMREMQAPTQVFQEIVHDYFRPLFQKLTELIGKMVSTDIPVHRVEQLALSLVGQCLYYRVGGGVVKLLIPPERRAANYDVDSLSRHIAAVTLAAIGDLARPPGESAFDRLFGEPLPDAKSNSSGIAPTKRVAKKFHHE